MPQIAQIGETYLSQLFWLAITFGFIYIVIGRGMLTKVTNTVDLRDQKIASDLAEAQLANDRVQTLHSEIDNRAAKIRAEAQGLISQAKSKAAEGAAVSAANANAEISDRIAQSETRIRIARDAAQSNIEDLVGDVAHDLIISFSGASITKSDVLQIAKGLVHG